MAITLAEQVGGTQNQPPQATAFTTACAANDLLVCWVRSNSATSPGTITVSDNVNPGTYTLLNSQLDAVNSLVGVYCFAKVASAAGTPTISCTESAAQYGTLYIARFHGFSGVPTFDTSLIAKFTGAATTAYNFTPITTNYNNELLLGFVESNSGYYAGGGDPANWTYINTNGLGPNWYAVVPTSGTNNSFVATQGTAHAYNAVFAGVYDAAPTASVHQNLMLMGVGS